MASLQVGSWEPGKIYRRAGGVEWDGGAHPWYSDWAGTSLYGGCGRGGILRAEGGYQREERVRQRGYHDYRSVGCSSGGTVWHVLHRPERRQGTSRHHPQDFYGMLRADAGVADREICRQVPHMALPRAGAYPAHFGEVWGVCRGDQKGAGEKRYRRDRWQPLWENRL